MIPPHEAQRHLAVTTLLSEAADHAAADFDAGWRMLVEGLAPLLEAQWGYCLVVRRSAPDPADPVHGWRIFRTLLPQSHPGPGRTLKWVASGSLVHDPTVQRRGAASGTHRADRHADVLLPHERATSPSVAHFEATGIGDELCGMHALDPRVEVFFGYVRRVGEPPFCEADRALLEFAVHRVGRLCRWLALSLGAYPDHAPLSPREREALSWLLRGEPEKLIAAAMGLKVSSCHQLVVSVYRKLRVQSRAELMALWL